MSRGNRTSSLVINDMGRKPTIHLNLPKGMRARRQRSGIVYFYYDTGGIPRKEIPLGTDLALAVKRWAELEMQADPWHVGIITVRYVGERFEKEVLPTKAPTTQRLWMSCLTQIYRFFDDPPATLAQIKPMHIRQYMDWRRSSPVRANRERALLSLLWNHAREWGYTDRPNPTTGIHGFSEAGRDHYVDDRVYTALWNAACQPLRDAMDIAYLTGQRPGDVLRLSRTDIRDGELWIRQAKTRARLRIVIKGKLARVIARVTAKRHKIESLHLVRTEKGQPVTQPTLRARYDKARVQAAAAAKEAGDIELEAQISATQFRDLRAKAATEKEQSAGIEAAKDQLGHTSSSTTRRYVRNRLGKLVTPTK
jgi:integrase